MVEERSFMNNRKRAGDRLVVITLGEEQYLSTTAEIGRSERKPEKKEQREG